MYIYFPYVIYKENTTAEYVASTQVVLLALNIENHDDRQLLKYAKEELF